MIQLYSSKEVDKKALKGARIAVLGYGSQGRAHALNLKDSGFNVVVGVRKSGKSWKQAKRDGLAVAEPVEAVNGEIFDSLSGMDAEAQVKIDETMIGLDGTPNKSRLGANALLGVSLAAEPVLVGVAL